MRRRQSTELEPRANYLQEARDDIRITDMARGLLLQDMAELAVQFAFKMTNNSAVSDVIYDPRKEASTGRLRNAKQRKQNSRVPGWVVSTNYHSPSDETVTITKPSLAIVSPTYNYSHYKSLAVILYPENRSEIRKVSHPGGILEYSLDPTPLTEHDDVVRLCQPEDLPGQPRPSTTAEALLIFSKTLDKISNAHAEIAQNTKVLPADRPQNTNQHFGGFQQQWDGSNNQPR